MPIYLIISDSFNLINEEIEKITSDAENIITCDYRREGLDFVLEEASYLSLFDETKYLIVKNSTFFGSNKLTETESKNLENYLNNPNPKTTIIFAMNDKLDQRKKITKIIKEKYQLINIENLNNFDLNKRVKNVFKTNKIDIDDESVDYIIKSSLNNYDLIINDINKMLVYAQNQDSLTFEEVKNLTSKNIEENIFRFSDAVVTKNTTRAFELFNDLKLIKEEPIILINNLAREFRLMYKCQLLLNRGLSKYQIAKELEVVDWLVDKEIKNSYNYSPSDLLEKIIALSNIDLSIKQGKIDKYLAIELFLLEI